MGASKPAFSASVLALATVLTAFAATLQAQSFARIYGGKEDESPSKILRTADGGLAVLGNTSFVTGGAAWLIKLAADGSLQWEKAYGAQRLYRLRSALAAPDGGFLMAGGSQYYIWLLKVDGLGAIEWQEAVPLPAAMDMLVPCAICPAGGSGYFVAGTTAIGEDLEIWILRVSSDGAMVWQKAYGLAGVDCLLGVEATPEGGCVVVGNTAETKYGPNRLLVFKIDPLGGIVWQRSLAVSGMNDHEVASIRAAAEGGYILGGRLSTTAASNPTGSTAFALGLGENGGVTWARMYDGGEELLGVSPTRDGGFIVTGRSSSTMDALHDILAVKLRPNGDIEWQKAYGAPFEESGSDVIELPSGEYALAGRTSSFGGVSGTTPDPVGLLADCCVLRVGADGELGACRFDKSLGLEPATPSVDEAEISLAARETVAVFGSIEIGPCSRSEAIESYELCTEKKLLTIFSDQAVAAAAVSPELGNYRYDAGSLLTLTAQAKTSDGIYIFSGWRGDANGTTNPMTMTITDDTTIRVDYGPSSAGEWGDGDGGDGDGGGGGGGGGSSGPAGCFVATAAYGSPLHPSVRLLREFRDRRLETNVIGRALERAYYRLSPAAARVIAGSGPLRFAARIFLVPFVAGAAIVLKLGWIWSLLLVAAVPASVRIIRRRRLKWGT